LLHLVCCDNVINGIRLSEEKNEFLFEFQIFELVVEVGGQMTYAID